MPRTTKHNNDPPQPAVPPDPATLPRPLTIFLNVEEHRAVCRALRTIHKDRAKALLRALKVDSCGERA